MNITDKMDYSTLLWMQQQPEWGNAVQSCCYSGLKEGIDGEGFAGYIEVSVTFVIRELSEYNKIYQRGFSDDVREEIMSIRSRILK